MAVEHASRPREAAFRSSLGDDVAGVERLIERGEPLGARRSTPPATLVERQPQRVEQRSYLLLGCQMHRSWRGAEGRLVETVDGSQPAREELAVDDALREALGDAESHLQSKLVQALADQSFVARFEARYAVANHHPL